MPKRFVQFPIPASPVLSVVIFAISLGARKMAQWRIPAENQSSICWTRVIEGNNDPCPLSSNLQKCAMAHMHTHEWISKQINKYNKNFKDKTTAGIEQEQHIAVYQCWEICTHCRNTQLICISESVLKSFFFMLYVRALNMNPTRRDITISICIIHLVRKWNLSLHIYQDQRLQSTSCTFFFFSQTFLSLPPKPPLSFISQAMKKVGGHCLWMIRVWPMTVICYVNY